MGDAARSRTDAKAGVVLLSGFLGAGKTTLLQRILSWQSDLSGTVVVVNEFGDAGIDGALLKQSGSDIVELSSGCICCTLSGDFKQSLERVRRRFRPRRVLIEASGVADPALIRSIFDDDAIGRHMRLDRIVTVLDADFWQAREVFGPLFFSQLETADLIVLNKIDLVEKEKVPDFLAQLHETFPRARVVPTVRCGIDPEVLWPAGGEEDRSPRPRLFLKRLGKPGNVGGQSVPAAGEDFVSFAFQTSHPLEEAAFERFIRALPWEVFRIKGPLRFRDRTLMLNHVGGRSDYLPWQGSDETRLVFIAWGVNPDEILRRLRACVVPD